MGDHGMRNAGQMGENGGGDTPERPRRTDRLTDDCGASMHNRLMICPVCYAALTMKNPCSENSPHLI
jgi:hypothetical protein